MAHLPVRDRRIDAFMSPPPPAVALDTDISVAARIMREHGTDYLLVLDGTRLVGILGETEFDLIGRIGARGTCAEFASLEPFIVEARASVENVVVAMREQRANVAVVLSREEIVGVVASTDLLRILAGALGIPMALRTPSEVGVRIRAEHARITSLINDIESLAKQASKISDEDAGRLRNWIRGLGDAMHAHLALEEEILVPLVREMSEAQADEMLREHAEQRASIEAILRDLDGTSDRGVLSVGALELVRAIRDDIEEEEQTYLREGALSANKAAG